MTFIPFLEGITRNELISLANLFISLSLLFIHLRNIKTQRRSYILTRAAHRNSGVILKYVSSEQQEKSTLIRLILFNPGSIAFVIQSLSAHKQTDSKYSFLRYLGIMRWQEIKEARWWPTSHPSCKDIKCFSDEYKSLYVKEHRDILISLPGYIDRNQYRFSIETSQGGLWIQTTIDYSKTNFDKKFVQNYYEK